MTASIGALARASRGLASPQRISLLVEGGLRAHVFLILAFLYTPILVVMIYSFNDSQNVLVWQGVSTRWYPAVWNDRNFREALEVSLKVATLSAGMATVMGTLLAVGIRDLNRTAQLAVGVVMAVAIITPEIILGVGSLLFFSRLGIPLSMYTITAAHTVFNTALVGFIVRARLTGMTATLEEASTDLGASPLRTFFNITVPLLSPAILAGALLAFTFSFDDFLLSFFVSGPQSQTLPLRIWSQIRFGVTPQANAVGALIIGFSLTVVLLSTLIYAWRTRRLEGDTRELITSSR